MYSSMQSHVVQRELSSDFQMKVFSLVGLALATSAFAVFTAGPVLAAMPFLGNPLISLVILLGLIFTSGTWAQIRPLNIILFLLIAYILGIGIAPLIALGVAVGGEIMIMKAFTATACLTVAAGMYGANTKRDLSGIRGFLVMALIGVIVVGILQIFWPSPMVSLIVSGISVILFSAFIAYDINTLKHYPENMAIEAAIGLYLSIFNLFRSILTLLISLGSD